MVLDGDAHLARRRAVLRTLQGAIAQEHARVARDASETAVSCWPRDTCVALHPRLRALTLEVILRTTFGSSTSALDDRLLTLHRRLQSMLSATASPAYRVPHLRHGPGKRLWERFLRDRAEVDDLIYALIDERRGTTGRGKDILAALLGARAEDGSPMSRRQLRDEIVSLIVAGHETTTAELAWAFQLLAHNPAAQRRLINEIDGEVDDEYLTASIQETLRHRPVFVFAIPRAVKQPMEIGDWTYRPPTHLLACIYLQHHNPDLYPEPDAFQPERFLEGQPSASTWLPWGGGQKRCPGRHLAMQEMKTVLRAVLSRATIDPASKQMEHPRWRSMIVTPHMGSRVVLHRRNRRSASI
jgi:cytochrome P450